MISAAAGAIAGAAGLAWWLLSKAEHRRRAQRQLSMLRFSRLGGGGALFQAEGLPDAKLQARVQELNQAIDEVRRQLEELKTQP
jgi:hypothetical protein